MKKILALMSFLLLLMPFSASAANIKSLNGYDTQDQFLIAAPNMHMQITESAGKNHTFSWNGTPWTVAQGGTGQTSFTPGALLYGNGTGALNAVAGGNAGDVLQYDGTKPVWVAGGGGGSTNPAGNNKQIQFNDNGAFGADQNFTFDKSNDQLVVGATAAVGTNDQWSFVTERPTGTAAALGITNYTNGGPTNLAFRTARGTAAAPLPVLLGDVLGQVAFNGWDGTTFVVGSGSSISGNASENWTPAAHGSSINFSIVPLGQTARVQKLRLEVNGELQLLNSPVGTNRQISMGTPISDPGQAANLNLRGASNTGTGAAGNTSVSAGTAVSGNGGNVRLVPGSSATGIPGGISLVNPQNTNGAIRLNMTNITTFHNVEFQDKPGTIAVLENNDQCLAMKNANGDTVYITVDGSNAIQVSTTCP